MFSTFDFCVLVYVIRLAGWLKNCNLSLSLSSGRARVSTRGRTTVSVCKQTGLALQPLRPNSRPALQELFV